MFTRTHPESDRVKGHIRDSSSNSMLLLTSSIIVPNFIILRRRVHELSWKQTDRRTDGHTRRSHNVFWWTLNKYMYKTVCWGTYNASLSKPWAMDIDWSVVLCYNPATWLLLEFKKNHFKITIMYPYPSLCLMPIGWTLIFWVFFVSWILFNIELWKLLFLNQLLTSFFKYKISWSLFCRGF